MAESKAQESRVRRLAKRNGYRLWKVYGAEGRYPGCYRLVDPSTCRTVAVPSKWDDDPTLNEIEEWLRHRAGMIERLWSLPGTEIGLLN